MVYLDVDEPLSFYFDLLLIGLMIVIASVFGTCIVLQHWSMLDRGFCGVFSALKLAVHRRARSFHGMGFHTLTRGFHEMV